MNWPIRAFAIAFISSITLIAAAQPPQAPRPGLRPPDITFTTMTAQGQIPPEVPTTTTARDWEKVEFVIPPGDSVQSGTNVGHWFCTPGQVPVRLDIPGRLRSHVAGVVFWSRWTNSGIESPIKFHTQRFRKTSESEGGPRRGSGRPGGRGQRPGEGQANLAGDDSPDVVGAGRTTTPMHVRATFSAPVHGEFQLWAEIVDHNGGRHVSPMAILHCAKELPPAPKDVPITDATPNRP